MGPRYIALGEVELSQALVALPGWRVEAGKLHKTFRFPGFGSAIAFMVRVAFDAERLDHHPNWSNVYDRVEVVLWTHDVGGLTDRDVALATAMQAAAAGMQAAAGHGG